MDLSRVQKTWTLQDVPTRTEMAEYLADVRRGNPGSSYAAEHHSHYAGYSGGETYIPHQGQSYRANPVGRGSTAI